MKIGSKYGDASLIGERSERAAPVVRRNESHVSVPYIIRAENGEVSYVLCAQTAPLAGLRNYEGPHKLRQL